jgi:hypothetical protein
LSIPPQQLPPQGYPAPGYGSPGYGSPGYSSPGAAPSFNPYQAPQAPGPSFAYAPAAMTGGIWRSGNLLVMHKMAQLPDVCVKSGEKATRRLTRKLQWWPPWINWTLLVAVIVYAILVQVLSQRATISIGLSEEWFKRRRMRMLVAWLIGLGGVAVFFLSFVLLAQQINEAGWLILVGVAIFFGALIYGQYATRLVHPAKIDEMYIYLKGVHPSVLAMFPEWPHPV